MADGPKQRTKPTGQLYLPCPISELELDDDIRIYYVYLAVARRSVVGMRMRMILVSRLIRVAEVSRMLKVWRHTCLSPIQWPIIRLHLARIAVPKCCVHGHWMSHSTYVSIPSVCWVSYIHHILGTHSVSTWHSFHCHYVGTATVDAIHVWRLMCIRRI